MERPVRVRILDHEYLIKSDEDDEYVHNIARFVNDKFREIKENMEGLSDKRTAILAAFDIASDYFQLLKERDDLAKEVQRRARSLNLQIDSVTAQKGPFGQPVRA